MVTPQGNRAAPMTAPDSLEAPPTRGWIDAIITYFEPRLIAVLFMGFSSGFPLALSAGTLQVWQTRAGVDLTTIGFFALVGVVYSLKFVWAPFMDRVSLPGPFGRLGHRRGWALLTQIGLMIAIVLLGSTDPTVAPALTALCAVLVAFCSASQDVVIDAYRIELLDDHQQGAGAAMTQYGYRFGMLASGAGALLLHRNGEGLGWFAVYLVMACLVLIGIATVLLTREPAARARAAPKERGRGAPAFMRFLAFALLLSAAIFGYWLVKDLLLAGVSFPAWARWAPNVAATLTGAAIPVALLLLLPRPKAAAGTGIAAGYADLRDWLTDTVIHPFRDVARHNGWIAILLFIVLFKLGDAIAGVMANPFYVKMGFSDEQIAWASKTFGLAATLIGVFIGGVVVARLGLMRALLLGGVIQMLSNLMFAGQALLGDNYLFLHVTIALENLSGGIGSAAFVAYISGLCSLTFTGTQYALFSSLAAIGRTVLSSPGGLLAEQMGWFNYFLLSTGLALPGLLMLLWMMRRYPPPVRATVAQ
jgi:PAT family beta-lactamase induction signal transducer AmpG